MDAIDYLRGEIKSHFPDSSELMLSSVFDQTPRFNFYFKITNHYPFLLYLNWHGDSDHFTIKSLEFSDSEVLSALIKSYPEVGSKAFNVGKPKCNVSFIYRSKNLLSITDMKGPIDIHFDWNIVSGKKLMECVDPEGR